MRSTEAEIIITTIIHIYWWFTLRMYIKDVYSSLDNNANDGISHVYYHCSHLIITRRDVLLRKRKFSDATSAEFGRFSSRCERQDNSHHLPVPEMGTNILFFIVMDYPSQEYLSQQYNNKHRINFYIESIWMLCNYEYISLYSPLTQLT